MAMIKRGDGSTGHIVEVVSSDDKGMCVGCGHLFQVSEMENEKCGVCGEDPEQTVAAMDAPDSEDPKPCCCGQTKAEG